MASFQLSYNKTIGKHAISALALTEAQKYNYWYNYSKATGFETDYFKYNNMQAGSTVKWGDVQSNATEYTLMSYLGRLNYMFDNRYVVTLNARADGSSKLGANHKWGFFPSASLAWIISNEGFMKNQRLFNNLKFRVGYGVTGNQDAIDPYRSLSLMSPNGTTTYNGATVTTYALDSNPNPDLKWETKYTFDAGIDFSMWRGRFSGTIDAYMSTTRDLLYTYQVPVPPFTYTSLLANMGEMSNNGIEIGLHAAPIETKDMGLTLQGNVAFQKNKLVSLSGTYNGQDLTTSKYIALNSASCNGLTSNTNVVYMTEGYPVNIFRLPVHDGFKTDDTGKKTYQVKDVNGDGGITLDDEGDREFLGQATPKVFASFGGTFRYKNWDLSTQLNGGFGHHIYNFTSLRLSNLGAFPTYNVLKSAEELGVYNAQHTSYWLEKGDYVNIEYITLGYNLPASKLGLNYIKGLRFALSCNNVATLTGYSGLTPILNNATIGGGIDNNVFPIMRTYTAMLSVKF
jgi:TonB-linked SusC/RagA family outer membrane protein